MRDIYDLRSKAVHTGTIGKKSNDKDIHELLIKAYRLTRNAISELLRKGDADWEQLVLS
jgi:hypothetical protein